MAGSLRGHLGVKSSPLCPTSSKLTTQYLVLDHMNNHYRKLSNVKPSIDNAPPKSIAKSQKVRDRVQREHPSRPVSRYSERPDSRNTRRAYTPLGDSDIYDEAQWGNPEDEEETNVLSIMKNVLKRPGQGGQSDVSVREGMEDTMVWPSKDSRRHTDRHTVQETRPVSARSMSSTLNRTGTPTRARPCGDVLEKRSHMFTEPARPFTPRTLKSNRGSRLLEYKYYTPSKKSSIKQETSNNKDDVDGPTQSLVSAANLSGPVPKPRKRASSAHGKLDVTNDSDNTLMFETLQTRDMTRAKNDKSQMVPPLDISVDKDHMNWLQEQASKAQIRVLSGRSQENVKVTSGKSSRDVGKSAEFNRSFGSTKSWAQDRLSSEEEEMKYVEFVKAVTQDVLDRGIFTNRVLLHAFENHVQKNKGILNERKMRSLLAQLREDLAIPSEREADLDEDNVGHSSRRSSGYRSGLLDRTRTLGRTDLYTDTLEKTGTSAWVSEDGGTLFSTKSGYYDTVNLSREHLTLSGTLGNTGDLLTVTQALETYQLNIQDQDSKENHLARNDNSNANSDQHSLVSQPDLVDEKAVSELTNPLKLEGETPRHRRRLRRQNTQDSVRSSILESASQVGATDNPPSIMSGKSSDIRAKTGKPDSVVSLRSQQTGSLQQHSEHRPGKEKFDVVDRHTYSHSMAENNHDINRDVHITNSEMENFSGDTLPTTNTVNSGEHNRNTERRSGDGVECEQADKSKPSLNGRVPVRNGGSISHDNTEGVWREGDHYRENGYKPDQSGGVGYGIEVEAENGKSGQPGEHSEGDQRSDPIGENGTYADDYEDDVDDADDEEATTLTHRTSDEDF